MCLAAWMLKSCKNETVGEGEMVSKSMQIIILIKKSTEWYRSNAFVWHRSSSWQELFLGALYKKQQLLRSFFFFFCVVASSPCGRSLESVLNVVVVLSLLFSYACVLLDIAYPIHAMSQRKKNNAKKGKLRGGWGAHHRRKFFLFGLGPIVHRAFLCNFLFRSYLGLWMVVFLFVLFLFLLLWTKKEREREKDARNQDPSLFAINTRVVAWNKCTFWQGSSNDVGLH